MRKLKTKTVPVFDDARLTALVRRLVNKNKCHTVILYGSRARGDFSDTSDYDLLGVCRAGKKYRIAKKENGIYLDIFVFPERDLRKIGEEYLYMNDAKILYEQGNFGSTFIRKMKIAIKKKYVPLSTNEAGVRRVWLHKMFDRISQGDIEGHYRRSWLHEALLCEYFNIRKKRYWGSKRSFEWLRANDPYTYKLFEKVLSDPLNHGLLRKLVETVSGLRIR